MIKLIINSDEVKSRALYLLNNLNIEKPREVIIREYKANRSASQSGLMWSWLTVIGNELGEQKDEVHERYKTKFLVPILERDDPEYAEMLATIRKVYRHDAQQGVYLFKSVSRLTSTTKANTKQMAEYLSEIEADARGLGIYLPHPGDYELSMGRAA